MRGPVPIPEATRPPLLGNAVNDDVRRPRNYDMQPPTIPHRVDGYQIDKNFNKCLDCHARAKTEFSQAIPVSATHYIDRERQGARRRSRRGATSACSATCRRNAVQPLVGNSFQGVDAAGTAASRSRARP